MRKLSAILALFLLSWHSGHSQYWQQTLSYTIDVMLNDRDNTLDGFENIEYSNHSPDTLHFIWFHLWPNAYKNDKTAYTDQSIGNGNTNFYFAGKEKRGYINRLDFKVDNITAETEDHPQYIDIVKLVLPAPLAPGQSIHISTPFHVKLPYNFNRGGYVGQHYAITHWYPKPAVYDKDGWHEMPMLEQGEFYSEFGSYDVTITLPDNYVVASTGVLQNKEEKEWLNSRSNFDWKPIKTKEKVKGVIKTTVQEFPASSAKTKTLHYTQDHIHDFAWFADKRFIVNHEPVTLANGKEVDCYTYYLPGNIQWQNSLSYLKASIIRNSELIGEYPYPVASVVQNPLNNTGGTEYPTITVLGAPNESLLHFVINHEVRHNWFYGILASNERINPWMDEGLNSYYDYRAMKTIPESGIVLPAKPNPVYINEVIDIALKTKEKVKTDQPIDLPSEEYSAFNYNLSVYHKAALWFQLMEKTLGTETFDQIMKVYFSQWAFKHPAPAGFKEIAERTSGRNMDSLFALLDKKGEISPAAKSKTMVASPFSFSKYLAYIKSPSRNLVTIGPAIGVNSYDKLMIGAFITNAKLPPSDFQFFLAPLYSTGAKKITGIGKINYTLFPGNSLFRRVDLFVNGSTFTMDEYDNGSAPTAFLSFAKIVPGIRFTLKEKSPRSTGYKYIQFKTYHFREDGLNFYIDTTINGTDTTISFKYNKTTSSRSLGQLKLIIENNRVLYPYTFDLTTDFNKDFVRLAFTGNYFFNYAKKGGMNLRLFAGKFIYNGSITAAKQFSTDRYHLNMTGADGYEDYTYSDYFIGRNRFEKLPSQQIMMRDGGFKVRTPLLANKAGKTDDWLAAINLTTTIPDKINPLSVLPIKIPVRLFFDIGTNAEGWVRNSEQDRFLYDAGFQVSLFKDLINIYFPVFYSGVYKDYVQSIVVKNKFIKTMSFSINISGFNPRRINNTLSL